MSNVPDDWGSYYHKCRDCGGQYHASEGGCGCGEVRAEEAIAEAEEYAEEFLPGCVTVDDDGGVYTLEITLPADFSADADRESRNVGGLAEEIASLLALYGATFRAVKAAESTHPVNGKGTP